jgi:hypothetical protein
MAQLRKDFEEQKLDIQKFSGIKITADTDISSVFLYLR